jgi:thioredoxin 1
MKLHSGCNTSDRITFPIGSPDRYILFSIMREWDFHGTYFMPAAYIQDEAEFDALLSAESLFVVDCTATWCGPCKLIAPLIDQLADEYASRVKILKLDLDANKEVAKRFGIRSIPAVMFFSQGDIAETLVGAKKYEEYDAALIKYLD